MLASICDAATERLIHMAVDELGPPPAAFAFIAMGSQGRQEQTLLTDQDNGIIYVPSSEAEAGAANDYFLQLGKRVCEGLEQSGYSYCRGGVMANNPRWCRPLPAWISSFQEGIQTPEPQEVIDLSIFLDFRTVCGDNEITRELRRAIDQAFAGEPRVFRPLAEGALNFKPPLRLLGSVYLGGGETEHLGEINLKDAMMPIVTFARLYSLRHHVGRTHTVERIESLSEKGEILPSSRDEIIASYDFLMQMRLQSQLAVIKRRLPLSNVVRVNQLGYMQKEQLKQSFAQISAIQKKIEYDFLGGA
jgi:CBS domain-containing protein